jgi:hypothetical protein
MFRDLWGGKIMKGRREKLNKPRFLWLVPAPARVRQGERIHPRPSPRMIPPKNRRDDGDHLITLASLLKSSRSAFYKNI